jgi:hypothetical protein
VALPGSLLAAWRMAFNPPPADLAGHEHSHGKRINGFLRVTEHGWLSRAAAAVFDADHHSSIARVLARLVPLHAREASVRAVIYGLLMAVRIDAMKPPRYVRFTNEKPSHFVNC